jgi:hypothetical protein
MPNTAVQLGVNRPNFDSWTVRPEEMTDFIANPNWTRRHRTKYYNTLPSTLIDTDGSSFKLSYLTPEWHGTSLGVSYIPQNNANDGLNSKFSDYHNKSGSVVTLYHRSDWRFLEAEFYAAFADYNDSHLEYAGGASLYRKGWTLFASYRQTETQSSDTPITKQTLSKNREAYFDGYRNGFAYNGGLGYEFAFLNTSLTWFESKSSDTRARNRILNWHNSVRPYKHFGVYFGAAWVDFRADRVKADSSKRGTVGYAGIELTF